MRRGILHDGMDRGTAGKFYNTWAKALKAAGVADVTCDGLQVNHDALTDETQIYCHGSPNMLFFGGSYLSSAQTKNLLLVTGMLPRAGGLIWVRACSVGDAFLQNLAMHTDCNVAGFTHTVHAFQGRLKVFSPDRKRLTPDDGVDTSKSWSMPWHPRTMLATQVALPKEYLL